MTKSTLHFHCVKNPTAAVASFVVELSQEFDEILHVNSLKGGLSKDHFWITSFLIGQDLVNVVKNKANSEIKLEFACLKLEHYHFCTDGNRVRELH